MFRCQSVAVDEFASAQLENHHGHQQERMVATGLLVIPHDGAYRVGLEDAAF
jgi:hypothetical protein